ncbi:arsenate reductase [Pedobacter yulinensis]|uniref:Arsenate reductase n=1 Tax=Pedobacter yulinensis TaxID=2126353 RepID=A0A2T3HQ71_9SPHI|nr:Spx/MgsR family RNA polymerase-binding regulatory protein [Pedobacter yulinensis]PST84592.1 arsenate reductase [Pedobacter yulinensis]
MLKVYGIPNCNTVKNALNWLKGRGIDFVFHDFKKSSVTPERLHEWFSEFGWEQVVNKKGLTWKKLTPEEQAAVHDESTAAAMLVRNTSAIKRPVIEQDGKPVLIGFQEAAYAEKLS